MVFWNIMMMTFFEEVLDWFFESIFTTQDVNKVMDS